jgi:hypothetical protein
MNHSMPMKIAAVVSALFGVVLLLAPNALMAMYRTSELAGPGVYNSMLYGGSLIAFAVMYWVASTLSEHEARTTILGSLVGNGLGLLVALYRQFTDPNIPATAWLNVVIFLAFTVVFAMLWFRGAERQPHARPAA